MLAQVPVLVSVVFDGSPLGTGGVLGHLVVMDRPGRWHVDDLPGRVLEALAEVGLVGVDEELRVEPVDMLGRLPPHHHRARLHPADGARAGPPPGPPPRPPTTALVPPRRGGRGRAPPLSTV